MHPVLRTIVTPLLAAGIALGGSALASASPATVVHEQYTDGVVAVDVQLPQLSGDDAVATAFNDSIHAAVRTRVDQINADKRADEAWTLSNRQTDPATVGPDAVSAALVTSQFLEHSAHPVSLVDTVVIDADTAKPITLRALFSNVDAGLARLSESSAELLPGTRAGAEFLRSGIEPVEGNFTHWIPTADGLQIYFDEYTVGPHAIGIVDITVPWAQLQALLSPQYTGLANG